MTEHETYLRGAWPNIYIDQWGEVHLFGHPGNNSGAGPKFREIFHEITGISLIDGLVEDK